MLFVRNCAPTSLSGRFSFVGRALAPPHFVAPASCRRFHLSAPLRPNSLPAPALSEAPDPVGTRSGVASFLLLLSCQLSASFLRQLSTLNFFPSTSKMKPEKPNAEHIWKQ